jgi:hypothetical protein
MNTKQVLKKIEQANKKHTKDCLKQAAWHKRRAKGEHREYHLAQVEHYTTKARNFSNVMVLKYYSRLKIFKTGKGHLDFNPETYLGHSYNWYEITKKIKNTVVLNTYRYSVTTGKQIWTLKGLFNQLGIKYKTIEAPKGLQNLEIALQHHINKLAAVELANKHKKPSRWFLGCPHVEGLKTLATLGYKPTKKQLEAAKKQAQLNRDKELERKRQKRAHKKLLGEIILIKDDDNQRVSEAGLHVVAPYGYGDWSEKRDRQEAVSKGFKTIFVHKTEPKLKAVK